MGGDFFYNDANNDFVFNENDNLVVLGSASITADNYSQSGAIDIAGDLSIQVSTEARLDDTASIKAKNLLFSAYNLYNQADFTITDNATFDIGNDFWNGFYLNGYQNGGDISAGSFNVTAGADFFNQFNATISADSFNVTAGDDFSNKYSATINADNFNVTAGDEFHNRDSATITANNFNVTAEVRFYNRDSATINAKYFNVTAGSSFYNPYSTISADNFNVTADYFYNYGVIVAGDARYFGSIFIENVNNLPIVPYGASSTDAIQSSSGIDIINIARPDSNGLSNNRYSDFNVLSSGLVFNNSSSAVSSSLAGTIAGNPNYAASDSASLILNQITSNNASYLGGMLESWRFLQLSLSQVPNGIGFVRCKM